MTYAWCSPQAARYVRGTKGEGGELAEKLPTVSSNRGAVEVHVRYKFKI